jgi:uncharacterized SAM-binding protein YcdF (DUF218 family)
MGQPKFKPFDSLVVMGKVQKTGKEPLELKARVALAACMMINSSNDVLLVSAGGPYLPDINIPVAQIVKGWAMQWGVPEDRIITSDESNNTIREVKVIQALLTKCKRRHPLVISHAYHLRRTKRYCSEIGLDVQVLPCSVSALDHMAPYCSSEIRETIQCGYPSLSNVMKEFCVENILSLIHAIDRSGKFESWLADLVRDGNIGK